MAIAITPLNISGEQNYRTLLMYLSKLEKGDHKTPSIEAPKLDVYLKSHLIDPSLLRVDKCEAFMADSQKRLLALIEQATGKAAYTGISQTRAKMSKPTRTRLKPS